MKITPHYAIIRIFMRFATNIFQQVFIKISTKIVLYPRTIVVENAILVYLPWPPNPLSIPLRIVLKMPLLFLLRPQRTFPTKTPSISPTQPTIIPTNIPSPPPSIITNIPTSSPLIPTRSPTDPRHPWFPCQSVTEEGTLPYPINNGFSNDVCYPFRTNIAQNMENISFLFFCFEPPWEPEKNVLKKTKRK